MNRVKTAILISGRGSNMAALIEAARDPSYPAEFALVISNDPTAKGLERAASAGIETAIIRHRDYPDRENFDHAIDTALRAHDIALVCLAGFMRILSPWFIERWQGRLLNIHPSLLPEFRGLHTHERALLAGVHEHGCTVHQVVPELDAGPIIAQARVPVLATDTPDTLAARVLVEELRLYPQALATVAKRHLAL